jgi:hypothetical protein
MDYILQALRCITPCITPIASFLGWMLTISIIRNRLIYRGPMPSDGPEEGFASKAARIEFFTTHDQRFRETVKASVIWFVVAIVASIVVWFMRTYSIEVK